MPGVLYHVHFGLLVHSRPMAPGPPPWSRSRRNIYVNPLLCVRVVVNLGFYVPRSPPAGPFYHPRTCDPLERLGCYWCWRCKQSTRRYDSIFRVTLHCERRFAHPRLDRHPFPLDRELWKWRWHERYHGHIPSEETWASPAYRSIWCVKMRPAGFCR